MRKREKGVPEKLKGARRGISFDKGRGGGVTEGGKGGRTLTID